MLRTPWPWLGGLLALAMWVPNLRLAGRSTTGRCFDLSADIADEYGGLGGRIELVLPGAGDVQPADRRRLGLRAWSGCCAGPTGCGPGRSAIAFLVVLAVFLVTGGKGYYLAGLDRRR